MGSEKTGDQYMDKIFEIMTWVVLTSAALIVLAPTLQRIASATPTAMLYRGQQYLGLEDSRDLVATDQLQWLDLLNNSPYTPWITASFFNDGPDSVFIAINLPSGFTELKSGESKSVNFSMADRRIEVIYFVCNAGESASVRAVGKY